MQALRILVAVLGLLLILGVAALGVGIAYRLNHPRPEPSATMERIAPLSGAPHPVSLPTGAKILSAQSDGNRVMVRLGLPDGSERLLLLDWKTGAILSALNLK
jgi:hypothetical protein